MRWPGRAEILDAVTRYAERLAKSDPCVRHVGLCGSYARGDWGVGSDADLLVIVSQCALGPVERYRRYYPDAVPVAVDLWVFTESEWASLQIERPGLARRLRLETIWL